MPYSSDFTVRVNGEDFVFHLKKERYIVYSKSLYEALNGALAPQFAPRKKRNAA